MIEMWEGRIVWLYGIYGFSYFESSIIGSIDLLIVFVLMSLLARDAVAGSHGSFALAHGATLAKGGDHAGLFLLSGHLLLFKTDPSEPSGGDEFENKSPNEGEGSDGHADTVIFP